MNNQSYTECRNIAYSKLRIQLEIVYKNIYKGNTIITSKQRILNSDKTST